MDAKKNASLAYQVSIVSIVVNMVLFAGKLLAGILGHSSAMISDAIHSASDVFSTFVVIAGVKLGTKQADLNHPYGHERLESMSALFLATMLALVGGGIGWNGITLLRDPSQITTPGISALIAAAVSILLKEAMYHYTIWAAKKTKSPALKADAWHHRSDALSSIGALIGIGGARLGFELLDPIASLVICVFILKVSFDILMQAVSQLTDTACDSALEEEMRQDILSVSGVVRIDLLRTRQFGSRIYVDAEIAADGNLTLHEAHEIAESAHHQIEQNFPEIKHCMIHVNPSD